MLAATLSALLLSAGPQLEAAVAAGAGYDSDLNHADQSVSAIGSGFATLRASGGASLELGGSTHLYGGVRLDGEQYPTYSDLSAWGVGAEASLVQALGDRTALVLGPWVSASRSGDPARDARTFGGHATLRFRPVRDLTLRALYAHVDRTASDPVFSSVRDRLGASAEWRLRAGTYLTLAGAVERGDEVFYRAAGATGSSGSGMMGHGDGFQGQEPYRASATSASLGPVLELGLGAGTYLLGSYEARVIRSGAADLRTQTLFVGVGARL